MNYTFTAQEFTEFISVNFLFSKDEYEKELEYISNFYEESKYWQSKISVINHIFCILLEQFEKKGNSGGDILEYIYDLPNRCDFEIQESTVRFLDILFQSDFSINVSLDDRLIQTQNKLYER